MASRIVIIQGHPDPGERHLCHALADAYAEAAAAAGHEVVRVELAALDFPLMRSEAEFLHGALPATLEAASDAIHGAQHIVFIFPLWLGTMPALLKGFLEHVMRPGLAFAHQEKGLPKKLLAGRSARVIVTMGMPGFFYRWFYRAHGVRGMERNILNFVGIKPVRETFLGNAEGVSAAARAGWIENMRALGRRAA
ncbi:NAD(P)H-dependent oxidoreductase [Kaistia dalseonensis]|uniref:NADPH-quinone reductase n=1 Tax=Kaistia dalseonensis TaxID=410840 RepID=A0ABU0HD81_9HYPH|nr:NAD(P)H-dependent oxidoreductase [Kaistia dalseonensis]MCX5497644.1 NAD(P)H-dependent oxidoreductase [Kaistia dalseonensis]MDQ0440286.1 putative NADPH-quinone reductase [Kaistia dalseonensis]